MPDKPNQACRVWGKTKQGKQSYFNETTPIIILTTFHLQGAVLIFRHIEPKTSAMSEKHRAKPKQLPHKKPNKKSHYQRQKKKPPQLGREFHTASFVAWHSIPPLSSSLSTLWGWDPQREHFKTPGCKTIKAHWGKHSRSLLCPQSHTHTIAAQWFCCF